MHNNYGNNELDEDDDNATEATSQHSVTLDFIIGKIQERWDEIANHDLNIYMLYGFYHYTFRQ